MQEEFNLIREFRHDPMLARMFVETHESFSAIRLIKIRVVALIRRILFL
jgi:hypothetical protein